MPGQIIKIGLLKKDSYFGRVLVAGVPENNHRTVHTRHQLVASRLVLLIRLPEASLRKVQDAQQRKKRQNQRNKETSQGWNALFHPDIHNTTSKRAFAGLAFRAAAAPWRNLTEGTSSAYVDTSRLTLRHVAARLMFVSRRNRMSKMNAGGFAPYAKSILRIVARNHFFVSRLSESCLAGSADSEQTEPRRTFSANSGQQDFWKALAASWSWWAFSTSCVAFVLCGEMAVAYFAVHSPTRIRPASAEGELAVLCTRFIFLYLVTAGPGPWSLDRVIRGKSKHIEGRRKSGSRRISC